MAERLVVALAAFALGLVVALFVCLALGPGAAGVPRDDALSYAELQRCAECDAPMWSDAWCENCYRIWSVASERR